MYKKLILLLFLFLIPFGVQAQSGAPAEEIFKAKVIEIISEDALNEDYKSQELKLRGLEDPFKDQEVIVKSLDDLQLARQGNYQIGDKVIVSVQQGPEDEQFFFIIDYVRTSALWWLTVLFVLVVLLVGRKHGARALIVLVVTFIIILSFIIPKILAGGNPVLISIIGAIAIMFLAVFGTEGFKKKSWLTFYTIIISLSFILILSLIFSYAAQLTGLANEEALLLVGLGKGAINMKGLLLAGFIIGTLGVLDDVIMSQVSLVKELSSTNPDLSKAEVYQKALNVGRDHINAIVNTLFLAYAGASLPLLILFSVNEPPFLTFGQVINNELIATEIVRTLIGSISLVLAMPLATWVAVRGFVKK